MTAEYVLREGETIQQLARELLDAADDPSQIAWSHRPDTYGGGVFVVTDDAVAQRVLERRRAKAEADAQPAPQVEAGDESETADESGGESGGESETADESGGDGTEAKPTTAQKRRAAKAAKEAAAQAEAPADTEQNPE